MRHGALTGAYRGGENFAGKILPLRNVAKFSPCEIFTACDQQLHCKFRCRILSSVPGEGKVQRCVCLQHAVVVDWDALKCRVAQDFESAHREIRGTIQSPPGNNSKLQDSWRQRNLPLPKLSPGKLGPSPLYPKPAPPNTVIVPNPASCLSFAWCCLLPCAGTVLCCCCQDVDAVDMGQP